MDATVDYLHKLNITFPMRAPVLRRIVRFLDFPTGSSGVDVGCGAGQPMRLLAEAVGPTGQVTGVDIEPVFLREASAAARNWPSSAHVVFREGRMDRLPFADGTFDWAWSADCAGYSDPQGPPAEAELTRVIRPGGHLAILGWSSQQLLPGFPRLEARLNATSAGMAPFQPGMKPDRHFLRTTGRLARAGVTHVSVHSFVGDIQGPVSEPIRSALIDFFDMRWGGARLEVAPADWERFRALCDPASPDFLPSRPDYYGFFTYTLFTGTVASLR